MTPSSHNQQELILEIYDAALNQERWPDILGQIQDLCQVNQCTLFFYDACYRRRNFAAAAKMVPEAIDGYLDKFIDRQASELNRQLRHLPLGQVITRRDMQQLAGTDYEDLVGNDYMETAWPNLSFQAGMVLLRGAQMCAGLGLQNFKDTPSISPAAIAQLQELAEHLVRAFDIYQEITQLKKQEWTLTELLDTSGQMVLLLDQRWRILTSNKAAAALISKGEILTLNIDGQLIMGKDVRNNELLDAVKKSLANTSDTTARSFAIATHTANIPIHARLFRISGQVYPKVKFTEDSHNTREKQPRSEHANQAIASYALLLSDASRARQIPSRYLQHTYGITEAECQLLQALVDGANLQQVAQARDTSLETSRGQLKSAMKKTNTHSQAELSQLVLCLCD